MSNRDIEKVAYRVAELTRGVEGLTRARQVARSIVSGKELDDLVKDAESAQDRLDTQDELINEIGDAADWWVPSAELTADAADEAHEAKMQALESLSDAIAALDGIENLEEELTDEIAAAQAAADAAATEANLAKLQALQNVQDILTLSSEQAVIADEARDAWNTAVQAGQDAATAAGIAAGKGKTIIQSATPSEEDRLPQNLWIDTTDGANTPKRWTGSTWEAVTDKVAVDAAATAVAAQSAADAAAAAAASAGQAATQALTTANGKTKLVRSTAAASGQGTTVGDVWWRFGNAQFTGPVIGQWTWSGSTWVPNTIGSEIVEALTVDKLTVTGGAKIPTAVIDTLVSDQAFFNAVHSNRIVVDAANFAPGPGGYENAWVLPAAATIINDALDATGRAIRILPTAGANETRFVYGPMQRVTPGEKIVAELQVAYADGGTVDGTWQARMIWYDATGLTISSETGIAQTTPNLNVSQVVTVPAGAVFGRVRFYVYPGDFRGRVFRNLNIKKQVGAVLIEDGAVTAPKITASEALSAKVAEFIKVKASQLVADNAAMNAAFIGQLVGDQAFMSSLYTNRVIVAPTDFAPGPAGYENAWEFGSHARVINDSYDITGRVIRILPTAGASETRMAHGPMQRVTPGEKIVAEFQVAYADGGTVDGTWQARMIWYDATGLTISSETGIAQTTPNLNVSQVVTVPAGAVFGRVRFYVYPGDFRGRVFRNLNIKKQVGAVLIEDGAVTADKIRADAIDGKTITGATIRAVNGSGQVVAQLASNGVFTATNPGTRRAQLSSGLLRFAALTGANSGANVDVRVNTDGYVSPGISIVSGSLEFARFGSPLDPQAPLVELHKETQFVGDTAWANFTRASGMSGTAQWRRYLGVIYVRMNITTSVASGDHVQLGTLPAAARPSQPTALNASGTAGPICTAYVDTAGVIRFRNANGHPATAPYVDGSFLQ